MELTNKKLVNLLKEKDVLVTQGREISKEIETIEDRLHQLEEQEKEITLKIEPEELSNKAKELQEQINTLIVEFEKTAEEIKKEKLSAIPKEVEEEHLALLKTKEQKERERNKIALKVQKIKDRAIPIIQKEVKPLLQEFEDIETAEVKDDVVEIKLFNHLEDWKTAFRKRAS